MTSSAVLLRSRPEAKEQRAAAVFVADNGHRPVQVAKTGTMVHEVTFLLLESPKRERRIEARAFVGDGHHRALARSTISTDTVLPGSPPLPCRLALPRAFFSGISKSRMSCRRGTEASRSEMPG